MHMQCTMLHAKTLNSVMTCIANMCCSAKGSDPQCVVGQSVSIAVCGWYLLVGHASGSIDFIAYSSLMHCVMCQPYHEHLGIALWGTSALAV